MANWFKVGKCLPFDLQFARHVGDNFELLEEVIDGEPFLECLYD